MQLVIDLGNTVQKVAYFEGNEMQSVQQFTNLDLSDIDQILEQKHIEKWILSSVTIHNPEIESILQKHCSGLIFNDETPLPIQNDYKTPETLGKDRLANAVAAHFLFPKKNVLVIDAGTCIKYDFISSEGNYCGGGISPGLQMRFTAMHQFTARLPLIEMDTVLNVETLPVTGDSTEAALISGGANGAILEMEGFISEYLKINHDVIIILTGGNMSFFESHLKSRIFAIPNLTLTGLYAVLEYNSRKFNV